MTDSNSVVFPKLYKKTNKDAIQIWTIRTETNVIISTFGQKDGKIQETKEIITEGKNLGKRNATTCIEQAKAEAKSRWTKKVAKGYVEQEGDAEERKVDSKVVLGGKNCMLAQDYDKHAHKIVFPAYSQPKLDGGRGILCATVVDSKWSVSAWSRNRKPIKSMKHITEQLQQFLTTSKNLTVKYSISFDGEFYNHSLKDEFEELMSLLRQDEPLEKCKLLQYHMYDIVEVDGNTSLTFEERMKLRDSIFPSVNYLENNESVDSKSFIKLVETNCVKDKEELDANVARYLTEGYEGGIVRNAKSVYEQGKRSFHLQKIKEFKDAEYKVIGVNEGRGKLVGHAASFICVTEDGTEFKAKCDGETSKLKEYFENPALWKDKKLTVEYFSLTKNKIPRFPIGKRFREAE